ncbi:MAG: Tad domain-containing protein [Marinobacterium sp.]|nr:Tad domain-containing protein [Marinobacterium sp.]
MEAVAVKKAFSLAQRRGTAGQRRYQHGSFLTLASVSLSIILLMGAAVSSLVTWMDDRLRLEQAVQSAALALARACEREKARENKQQGCQASRYDALLRDLIGSFYPGEWDKRVKLRTLEYGPQADGRYRVAVSIRSRAWFDLTNLPGLDEIEQIRAEVFYRTTGEPASPVEVALVVDNSGSMGSSFGGQPAIDHLRDAMNTFIDSLPQQSGKLQNIRLAVIPFTHLVALHPQGLSAPAAERLCYEGDPESFKYSRMIWEQLMLAPWSTSNTPQFPDSRQTWSIFGDCNQQMQAHYLTDDLNFIRSNLQLMHATGATSTELGIIWGWRALDPRWRRNRPVESYAGLFGQSQKIMVVFSDAPSESSIPMVLAGPDDRSHLDSLCGSIKARDIELFTVRLGTSGGSTLESCATDNDHYQATSDPTQIVNTFRDALNSIESDSGSGFSK